MGAGHSPPYLLFNLHVKKKNSMRYISKLSAHLKVSVQFKFTSSARIAETLISFFKLIVTQIGISWVYFDISYFITIFSYFITILDNPITSVSATTTCRLDPNFILNPDFF